MLEYSRNLKHPSRELRTNMTDAEQRLWAHVRRKQISGIQFYRQKPLGLFIVDFYAPAVKLVIELDGSQHHDPDYLRKDVDRDSCLASQGLLVIRFDNRQVLPETDAVAGKIEQVCRERQIPSAPPLAKSIRSSPRIKILRHFARQTHLSTAVRTQEMMMLLWLLWLLPLPSTHTGYPSPLSSNSYPPWSPTSRSTSTPTPSPIPPVANNS